MPIDGVEQPELIPIDDTLRLRKFDGCYDFAFSWYQDVQTVYLVDGMREPYTWEKLGRMYRFLERQGELYFIEIRETGVFRPVGDVCFSKEDLPIVIGEEACRGRGLGRKVISALIRRGQALGYDALRVREIFEYNTASRKCFESLGFRAQGNTEKGNSFVRSLQEEPL